MAEKRLARSTAVLDEADRASRVMDWVLFCHEQEQILYGGDENEWRPGKPLGRRPLGEFFGQQTVRRMIDVFDDLAYEAWCESNQLARCEFCDVWFIRWGLCWICCTAAKPLGPHREPAPLKFFANIDTIQFTHTMETVSAAMQDFGMTMQEAYRRMLENLDYLNGMRPMTGAEDQNRRMRWDEYVDSGMPVYDAETNERIYEPVRFYASPLRDLEDVSLYPTATEAWRGANVDYMVVDEVSDIQWPNASVSMTLRDPEPIVELPEDLDLSGVSPVPLPRMPEVHIPERFTRDVQYRPTFVELYGRRREL